MIDKMKGFPIPSDYFGVFWALAGLENSLVVEIGPTGNLSYNKMEFFLMKKYVGQGKFFSTGLDEDNVVMGKEENLIDAIRELDEKYNPDLISLVASSVTSVIGMDLEGIAYRLESEVKAKIITFSSGGFLGNYQDGIKEVYKKLFELVDRPQNAGELSANIIGPGLDSFNNSSDIKELRRLLKILGVKVHTSLSTESDLERIKSMANVSINIVTRDLGLEVAELFKEKYGIPYVYGMPFGIEETVNWLLEIANKLDLNFSVSQVHEDLKVYGKTLDELLWAPQKNRELKIAIAAPYDYALGLTSFIKKQWGLDVDAVMLTVKPEITDSIKSFEEYGVGRIMLEPTHDEAEEVLKNGKIKVFFGDYHKFQIGKDIPIKIQASFPAFDCLDYYDGTPYVGFRGTAYLTQLLVNGINQKMEDLYR